MKITTIRQLLSQKPGNFLRPKEIQTVRMSSDMEYCMDLVRKHDYENFLCTLLVPDREHRTGIFAIRAFNTEIALIRDQVTQRDIGLGRFVFWRDAIRLLFKARLHENTQLPKHPIVEELYRQVMSSDVHQKWFINLIESREEGLADTQYETIEELETYCDKSVTAVLYLILNMLNFKHVVLDHTCSHLGKAIGLTNFIRAIPYNAQRRRVLVPRELLIKHNVSQESFIRFSDSERIQSIVFELASQAHIHYETAKAQEAEILKLNQKRQLHLNPLPFFLCAQPTKIYMKRLEKFNFNPYEPALNKRYTMLPCHLYYRNFRKQYY